jgi:4-amino-4-deoxy-L-arabinose transferase-like glycosyltransferase
MGQQRRASKRSNAEPATGEPARVPPVERAASVASPRGGLWALLALLAIFFALRWPFREALLIRDEGEYAHLAQRILQGELPYRDVYNQKPPIVFWIFAAIQALAGESLASLRIATTLVGMATASLLFVVARRLFGVTGALASVVAFTALTFDQCGVEHAASTEFFMLAFFAAGLVGWFGPNAGDDGPSAARALLAGVAAGLACQTKQTGLALLAFFVLERAWSVWRARSVELAHAARQIAWTLAGFALVCGAIVAYFAAHGALGVYVECVWRNNLAYVGERHSNLDLALLLAQLVLTNVARWDVGLWLLGAFALGRAALREPRERASGLWILLALTAGAAFVAGRPYVQYWEPLIVPLALGAGVATRFVADRARHASSSARLTLCGLLALPLVPPVWNVVRLVTQDPAARADTLIGKASFQPSMIAERIAQHVAERTQPDEKLLVVGTEPELYFLARRPAATRLVITYPLVASYPYSPALRREFLADVERADAKYVVYLRWVSSLTEWPNELESFVKSVEAALKSKYAIETGWKLADGVALDPARARDADVVLFRRVD